MENKGNKAQDLVSVLGGPGIRKRRVAADKQEPGLGSHCLRLCHEGSYFCFSSATSQLLTLIAAKRVWWEEQWGGHYHTASSPRAGSKGGRCLGTAPSSTPPWMGAAFALAPSFSPWKPVRSPAGSEGGKAGHCCPITLHRFSPIMARRIVAANGPWKHVIPCSWKLPLQRELDCYFCALLQWHWLSGPCSVNEHLSSRKLRGCCHIANGLSVPKVMLAFQDCFRMLSPASAEGICFSVHPSLWSMQSNFASLLCLLFWARVQPAVRLTSVLPLLVACCWDRQSCAWVRLDWERSPPAVAPPSAAAEAAFLLGWTTRWGNCIYIFGMQNGFWQPGWSSR